MEKSLQETKLIQEIEKRRKEQNDFRQKTAIEIKQQDIETEKQILELERDVEFSRLEKQRLVDVKLAEEKATTAKEEARKRYESEEAYIMAEEQIKNAKTAQQKNVDTFKIAAEQETRVLDIEKAKRIEIEEKQRQLDVIEKSKIVLKSKMEEEVARAKAVEAEEKLGSLPGNLEEKLDPYIFPSYYLLNKIIGKESREKLKQHDVIEVFALAYMRGMNIDNSILIFEESQNCTPSQMKLLLTRIGFNSKFFISGDVEQTDRYKDKTQSGLYDALNRFREIERIGVFEFENADVIRNPLISKILDKYD